jgi:stringent starvation protein B
VTENEQKHDTAVKFLHAGMLKVYCDARQPGVVVPLALAKESELPLNFSYKFAPPDLVVNEWGLRATLSFYGSRFRVSVPWASVFAIYSHPRELLVTYTRPGDPPTKTETPRRGLRLVH